VLSAQGPTQTRSFPPSASLDTRGAFSYKHYPLRGYNKTSPAVAGVRACNKKTLTKKQVIPFYPCRRGRLQGRKGSMVPRLQQKDLDEKTSYPIFSLQARTPARAKGFNGSAPATKRP